MKTRLLLAMAIAVTAAAVSAQQPVLPPDAAVKIEGIVAFTEGPAWHPSGNVFFTDIENNRIVRRDPTGAIHTYRTPSGRANGLVFDPQGRLCACEGGGMGGNRRVTRAEADGTITVLADRYLGRKLNSPNDLTMDTQGRIYFSDPRYGDRSDIEQFDEEGREIEGVYRIDPDGSIARIITHEVDRPNGVGVSPGDQWLYVADNLNDGPAEGVGGARKLWRFDLRLDGTVDPASRRLIFDWGTERGPDGIALDVEGRVYAAAGFNTPNLPAETADRHLAGIYIFAPEGSPLGFIPVPEDMITNCTFGGDDMRTLFITAGHKLWSVRVNTPGYVPRAAQ